MSSKKDKVTHSQSDSIGQPVYFSRSFLPAELINKIMSYLLAESLGNLASTSRETCIIVHNWLCTKEAVRNILVELDVIDIGFIIQNDTAFRDSVVWKIARFMLWVTVILTIEERMDWIFKFVPRVIRVCNSTSTFRRVRWNTVDFLSAVLILLDGFASDEEIYIAVKDVLRRNILDRIIAQWNKSEKLSI